MHETSPKTISFYIDLDGTATKDMVAWAGLTVPSPTLRYRPRMSWTDVFESRLLAKQRYMRDNGIPFDGPRFCNLELVQIIKEGLLPGLSLDVMTLSGAKFMKLFEGYEYTLRLIREFVHVLSDGKVDVRFIQNTAGLTPSVEGSEVGRLTDEGVIEYFTGQVFSERWTRIHTPRGSELRPEIDRVIFHYSDKGTPVRQDVANNKADPRYVVCVGDGLTDWPMFEQNKLGVNILLNSFGDLDTLASVTKRGQHVPNLVGPLPADWRPRTESGTHKSLFATLVVEAARMTSEMMGRPLGEDASRAGTYASQRSSVITDALARVDLGALERSATSTDRVSVSDVTFADAIDRHGRLRRILPELASSMAAAETGPAVIGLGAMSHIATRRGRSGPLSIMVGAGDADRTSAAMRSLGASVRITPGVAALVQTNLGDLQVVCCDKPDLMADFEIGSRAGVFPSVRAGRTELIGSRSVNWLYRHLAPGIGRIA